MRNCPSNLSAMKSCCKAATGEAATVMPYIMSPDPNSNITQQVSQANNGIYCFVGDMTFQTWQNCTSQQGVEAGICSLGLESYLGGAGREGPADGLLGVLGLVMVVKAIFW
jgi:hypothetical protein